MANENVEIWQKLDRESGYAYECFLFFLKLGPDRTVREAYRQKTGKPAGTKVHNPNSTWRDWSTKNDWYKRAEAYDAHIANLQRQAAEKEIQADRSKWIRRKSKIRNEAYDDSKALRAKAREILSMPLVETETSTETLQEDGRTVVVNKTIVKPLKFGLSDVTSMLNLADRLGRLAADMITDRIVQDSAEEERLRQLEDARHAFRESENLFPDEPATRRAEAIAAAYGFTIDQVLGTPSLSSDSVQ